MILKPFMDQVLQQQGLLTDEQLGSCLVLCRATNQPIEEVAIQQGYFTDKQLRGALENHFGAPYVDLATLKLDTSVLRAIPERVMRDYQTVSFRRREDGIEVATVNPMDVDSMNYLSLLVGTKVHPFVTTPYRLERFIAEYFTTELMQMLIEEIPSVEEQESRKRRESVEGSTVRLVDTILEQAVARRASDIHLEPQQRGYLIRFRRDGLMETVQMLPRQLQNPVASRIKIMAEVDIAQRRLPQDGQFRIRVYGRDLEMRVSTMPCKYGEKIVVRVLDKSSFALGVDHLGLSATVHAQMQELLKNPAGMILTSGPTGSGKTTTLYAIINKIRRPEINIMTFEDPIEYELLSTTTSEGGITQVQMNPKIGLTFASALRSSLRQDPDVMMVGEIRDRETAEIACQAAVTGHLILSTIHTTDAAAAITRLADLGADPFMVSATLNGVMAQRLVRLLCAECKEVYRVPPTVRNLFMADGMGDTDVLYHPVGCRACNFTGYQGRRGVYELIVLDRVMRDLILNRAPASAVRDAARNMGVKSLREQGLALVFSGQTTVAELLRIAPGEDEDRRR